MSKVRERRPGDRPGSATADSRRSNVPCDRALKLIEADDVADMLGMSRDWVYAEVRADRIPHVKLGRYVRFRAEAIEDWILERERGKIRPTK